MSVHNTPNLPKYFIYEYVRNSHRHNACYMSLPSYTIDLINLKRRSPARGQLGCIMRPAPTLVNYRYTYFFAVVLRPVFGSWRPLTRLCEHACFRHTALGRTPLDE